MCLPHLTYTAPMPTRLLPILLLSLFLAACGTAPLTPHPPAEVTLTPRPASAKGNELALYALGLLNTGYRFGGKNPEAGLDCSGMVSYIFAQALGMRLTGSAADMAQQGQAFPPLYRAMVSAGERSGALPQILERLADLLERQQQVRGKMIGTLVYPAALSVTAVAVVIALMTFVVPRVVEQFDSMGRELPLLTRVVIGVSDFINQWGWLVATLLVIGGIVFARLLKRDDVRLRFDGWLLRLPLLGRVLRDLHAARMSRTLAIMLDSGLPLIEGLAITARTVGNRVLRAAIDTMVTAIDEGGSMSSAMKRAGVFPPTLLYMTGSGENSGRLAPMLDRAADYLEREIDTFSNATLSLLEPGIIIVLGGVVAMIVLSILLPILQFNAMALG